MFHTVFPRTEQSVMFHMLLHKSRQIHWWGPAQFHWMFPFDRLVGRCKRFIHRRRGCEANLVSIWRVLNFATVMGAKNVVRTYEPQAEPDHDSHCELTNDLDNLQIMAADDENAAPATCTIAGPRAFVSAPRFQPWHVGGVQARNTQWKVPAVDMRQLERLTKCHLRPYACKVLRKVKVGGLERGCEDTYNIRNGAKTRRTDGVQVDLCHLRDAFQHGVLPIELARDPRGYLVGRVQFFLRVFCSADRDAYADPVAGLFVGVRFFPFVDEQPGSDERVHVKATQTQCVYLRADALGPLVGYYKKSEASFAVVQCYHTHVHTL